ncbi:MAG: cysteine desulfurase NifS [Verrucomicrobia bacterium]|nr:cysteine desulfurase NifS [Verrucomicrobiota bacterium]MBU4286286.1 cysteine desulfurase NifS [Verrucomicrobiota bacterium]
MKTVYLDNNATTQPAPEVIEAMLPFFTELWGNPSSMHVFGGQVRRHVELARAQVAELIGADPSEILFTSCGTESDNMAIRGAVEAASPPVNVITTRVEHPAVLEPCRMLKERGVPVIELEVDDKGQIRLDDLRLALSRGRAVVSLMWANNETGVIFPMAEATELVKASGGIMHTDAIQAAGKLPIDVRRLPVDLLSLSGHKLHAPKGIGVLFIRRGTRIRPLLLGGHQENGKRGGTENVPYIVGLGHACELAARALGDEMTRVATLRDRLQAGIQAACPDVRLNGDEAQRLPNTLNISFQYIEGESILYHLSDCGIAASSGSACTSGSLEPSHVIRAMGVPFMAAHGSIRFSLSRYNTAADIEYVLKNLPPIIKKLRAISPFAAP